MRKLPPRTLLIVVLLAAALSLVGLSQAGLLGSLSGLLLSPLTVLQRGVTRLWGQADLPGSPDAVALQQRNQELEAEVGRLQQRLVELEENQADLLILSNLLNYARSEATRQYLAANVIGLDPSPFLNYILLDRGLDDGVRRDMPVVTDAGLVGRVVEVTGTACKVQLVTDTRSAVNARLQTSRERGVVIGTLGGGLEMQYLSQQVLIEPGERVVTSGLGGLFPPGLLLGSVSAVQKLDYEVLQRADVTPGVNFSRLEIVLIITDFQPFDFSPFLAPTPTP